MSRSRKSLRNRITIAVVMGISTILIVLGIASHYIIENNINESLNKKLALARFIRSNVDNILKDSINRLYDISLSGAVNLDDPNLEAAKEALKTAYRYSIFTDGVFLIDRGGTILVNYPQRIRESYLNVLSREPVNAVLALGKPVISNVFRVDPSTKKGIYVLVPLRDKNGRLVGAAGGQIDPTNLALQQKFDLIELGRNEFVDIVDSNGVVLASSRPSRMFTRNNPNNFFTVGIGKRQEQVTTCHVCHSTGSESEKMSTNVMTFVPLDNAPWGVSIQQPRDEVFASSLKLQRTFIVLGILFLAGALVLTYGLYHSIVNPLKALILGADGIAKGDLTNPIVPQGSDEIWMLSRSFETMRIKLVESLNRIRRQNLDLENRVQERTRQIKEGQQRAEVLLKKIITTQEDERKRIARDLHDAALQDLSAALMRIDMFKLHPEKTTGDNLDKIREVVLNVWDDVLDIIQNLRPTLLDDLGLTPAIKSLLDKHLGEKHINYFLNAGAVQDKRFGPALEITLFRIIQEVILNVARHAKAENVSVVFTIEENRVHVDIEDDGQGFDLRALFHQNNGNLKDRRGLGLLGMKERAALLGGKLEINSEPGAGTTISIEIPLVPLEVVHVQKDSSHSR